MWGQGTEEAFPGPHSQQPAKSGGGAEECELALCRQLSFQSWNLVDLKF